MKRRALDDALWKARSAMKETHDAFGHYNYPLTLDKLEVTRQALADVELTFSCEPEAVTLVKEMSAELAAFSSTFDAKMLSLRGSDILSKVGTAITTARDDMNHYNWPKALMSLANVRQLVDDAHDATDVMVLQEVVAGIKAAEAELEQLDQRYTAEVGTREMAARVSKFDSDINEARNFLSHFNLEAALNSLQNAVVHRQEVADSCASMPKELGEFMTQSRSTLDELNAKAEAERERVLVMKLSTSISSALNDAENCFSQRLDDRLLVAFSNIRNAIAAAEEEKQALSRSTELIALISSTKQKVSAIERQWNERNAAREVAQAISACQTSWREAQDMFSHHRHAESLSAIVNTKEKLVTLSKTYGGNAECETFLETMSKSVPEFVKTLDAAMEERAVDASISKVQSSLLALKTSMDHYNWPAALTALGEARRLVEEIEGNSHPKAVAAASGFRSTIGTYSANYTEKVTTKEFTEAAGKADSAFSLSRYYLSQYNLPPALIAWRQGVDARVSVGNDFSAVLPEKVESWLQASGKVQLELDTALQNEAARVDRAALTSALGSARFEMHNW